VTPPSSVSHSRSTPRLPPSLSKTPSAHSQETNILKEWSQEGEERARADTRGSWGHSHIQAAFLCPGAVSEQRSEDKLQCPSDMPPLPLPPSLAVLSLESCFWPGHLFFHREQGARSLLPSSFMLLLQLSDPPSQWQANVRLKTYVTTVSAFEGSSETSKK